MEVDIKCIIIICVLILGGFCFWRFFHSAGASTADMLASAEAFGSDVSKPHKIEFYIEFKDSAAAAKVCGLIPKDQYDCVVEDNEGESFDVTASIMLVPNIDEATIKDINARSDFFKQLASEHGGEYLDWSIEYVKADPIS